MKNKLLIITIIFFTFLWIRTSTFACSCMIQDIQNSSEISRSIFIWTVSEIEEKKSLNSYDKFYVNFSGIKNIKWNYETTKKVYTAQSSASCWFNFEEWKEYIVYTNWDNKIPEVYLCSRSSLLENADEDIEYFKEIIDNKKDALIWKNNNYNNSEIKNMYSYIAIILLAILTIILWIKYYKKKN